MDWPLVLLFVFGGLILLMASGMPVAFCFMLINVVGAYMFWGGEVGLQQLSVSIFRSISRFTLIALPLFILMGEVMFRSGIAPKMLDTIDKWLGRLPGRLALEAVAGGALFATLSGSSAGSVAMLGSTLVPEMEKRGYKKTMSLGPILGSGGLAIMIPPTGLGVLLGAIAEISIGQILIAIIVPGFIMAIFYAAYIIGRSYLQPHIAPTYDTPYVSFFEKILATARYILPLALIIFLVIGVIFMGISTPSEAAASGALGTFVLAAFYRKLNRGVVTAAIKGALEITIMIFFIIAGASAFSQILAFSGATPGLINFALGISLSPLLVIIMMQVIVLVMGMFMDPPSILMVSLPLFMPIVGALGFNEVWFAVIMLLNIEMATTSPPFGMGLFVMKGVAPSDTTIEDCYRGAIPFLLCDLVVMAMIIAFPPVALWLPSLMR